MDSRFVGGQVEVIRPNTGDALRGTCLAHTKDGYIIEAVEEEVFGAALVVAWLKCGSDESVVEGRIKPVNGPIVALRTTGSLLRVSRGRENRIPVENLTARCLGPYEGLDLSLTDAGCHGFGFAAATVPDAGVSFKFVFESPNQALELEGSVVHSRPIGDGLYRGGVNLLLDTVERQRLWLVVLAMSQQKAA